MSRFFCISPIPGNAVECLDLITGTFTCKCNDGFEGDGHTCDDINECLTDGHMCDTQMNADNNTGNGNCTNTPGSYECWCPPPFVGSGRVGDWLVLNLDFEFWF